MGKMEIEVKVLNIDVEDARRRIIESGGLELGKIHQRLFTYDLPTIRGRYTEILDVLNSSELNTTHDVAFSRMKNLLFEIDNLESNSLQKICKTFDITKLENILLQRNYLDLLNSDIMLEFVQKLTVNPNKWIRLRDSNGKITLATKHILMNNGTKIQQLMETEIDVSSFEETNDLLLQLGFVHKSYQEKKRIKFRLNNHEIDIDFWPGIPAFLEVEGKSENDIECILNKIGYSLIDTVSCTADEIYRMNGKSMFESRELKFNE